MKNILAILMMTVLIFSCNKDIVPEPSIQSNKVLEGKYVSINTNDTISIIFDYFSESGVYPNTNWYYIPYPKFSQEQNYSIGSSYPLERVKVLDYGRNDVNDSIIPTISTNLGIVVSGKLKQDTLYLIVSQNNSSQYFYKYVKN